MIHLLIALLVGPIILSQFLLRFVVPVAEKISAMNARRRAKSFNMSDEEMDRRLRRYYESRGN